MKMPPPAVINRFILLVFLVLAVCFVVRVVLFEGPRESLGAPDVIIAIAMATALTGGWFDRKSS